MILKQRATVKRSFTIPELHAGPPRIGTHRPPSTKWGPAGWQEAGPQNSAISLDAEAPNRTRIRILSLDSHPLFQEGIARIIREEPDIVLVSQASTVQEAIQQYREHRPDITLMESRLPDLSGIEALIAIRAEFPAARIIILTTCEGDVDVQRALQAGARGYLLKNTPPKELLQQIRKVHSGQKVLQAELAAKLAEYIGEDKESLRTKELSWRQIVDNIPGFVHTTTATGEVEFHNHQVLEYFGKTNEELKDWFRTDIVHPDDRPRVIEALRNSIETGQPYDIEQRCRRADGVYRWFQARAHAVRDTEGRITAWYWLLTDIEDRKRAEEKLKRSEAFLAEGQRLSQTGSFSWCVETDEITWSEELYRIFELDDREPVTLERIGGRVYPDDLPLLLDMMERARAAAADDFEYHHRLLLPDNSVKHIHLVGHATRDRYGRLEYVGSAQDVTQQRLAQEQLTLITNVIPTFIHVLRTDGSVLYANRAVLDYTGLTLDDVVKEDYRDRVFHPEDVERLREERREALTRPVPFENEQRVRDRNGRYRWFLARYNPLLDKQGKIDRWYVAAFDIEDRKRTEHLRLEERVNERNRIARELHDTLLQSVLGLLMQLSAVRYLIRSRPGDAEELLDRMVERAREAVAEGRDAVQGLRSSIDVSKDLVRAIAAFGEALLNDSNFPEYRVTIEGKVRDLPPLVCDEVHRIAGEALRNAFRHASAARIEVQIHYDIGEFRLRVRDNGKGIESSVLDTGRRIGHHGLPGMRERAELIGGILTIRSDPGSGTEVELTISAALAYINTSLDYPENTHIATGSSFS